MRKQALTLIAATVMSGAIAVGSAHARSETRTLSMFFPHTGESITVTYKKDGRYIPAAMRKINYFLRDWRRDAVTTMDPTTIDLLWELHADLGSKVPVQIISGYRSAATNSFLKKIGRNVAKKSMHIQGKAIDVVFPDVPLAKLRGSALVRQVGGVGYYPRSGKYGFVHIDSGRVRHWPGISSSQMAQIFRDYRKTVGARFKNGVPDVMVASNETESAPAAAPKPTAKPEVVAAVVSVPTPRPRPMEVLAAAAAEYNITPASAPVPKVNFAGHEPAESERLGAMMASASLEDVIDNATSSAEYQPNPASNGSAKGSFAATLIDGSSDTGVSMIKPLQASASGGSNDLFWWPTRVFGSSDSMVRLNGAPQPFDPSRDGSTAEPVRNAALDLGNDEQSALQDMILSVSDDGTAAAQAPASQMINASGKADMLLVQRSGKGDMVVIEHDKGAANELSPRQRLARMFEAALGGSSPIGFGN